MFVVDCFVSSLTVSIATTVNHVDLGEISGKNLPDQHQQLETVLALHRKKNVSLYAWPLCAVCWSGKLKKVALSTGFFLRVGLRRDNGKGMMIDWNHHSEVRG